VRFIYGGMVNKRRNAGPRSKNFVPRSRFGHSVRRPGQIVCPNRDKVCPNNDKIYLTVVTSKFLLPFFAYR